MKVLIATEDSQQHTESDHTSALSGELVLFPRSDCHDNACGCGRGWRGVASGRISTTAMVADRPDLDVQRCRAAIFDALDRDGWVTLVREIADLAADDGWDDPDETIDAIIDEHIEVIEEICDRFGEGTVLCREGRLVRERLSSSVA